MARPITTTVFVLSCFLGLIVGINADASDQVEAAIRTKRQTVTVQRPAIDQVRPSLGVGGSAGASAVANALSSVSTNDGQLEPSISSPPINTPSRRPKRPKIPATEVGLESDLSDDETDDERPAKVKKPKRRRPANRRPAHYDEEDDYEDCNDDYDYGHAQAFHEAATRPMRHFSRMMEGMFSKMRGLAAGDFERVPGGNAAVASSSSSGDGYSRVSSVVNNNGRTRGVVTETRNGRTKTRRIDSGADDDEEDE